MSWNIPSLGDIWNALGLFIEGGGGTSEFYSNSTAAYRWILEQVINPNPQLTPEERANLVDQLNIIYGDAFDRFGETPEGAFYIWETFSNYVYALGNADPDLINIVVAAEESTEAQKEYNINKDKAFGDFDDDVKNLLKLTPWWVWAGLGLSLLTLLKK